MFTTNYKEIIAQVEAIDATRYAKTRNFHDGAVTQLSPYISRGVISTAYVFKSLLKKDYKYYQIDKFVQELAWRDYWQQIWIAKGDLINTDLKRPQPDVENYEMPLNIVEAKTGIEAVDNALKSFYQSGYLHNHMRMYVAALACNIGKSHWKIPAQWMYYHLLDADWASNALSWQWVAGSNSSKKYFANQDNINKYWKTTQQETFVDVNYQTLTNMPVPVILKELVKPTLHTKLPEPKLISIDSALPTCIYNFYNLDPTWKNDIVANRVLLLEPLHFQQYPVVEKTIDFLLKLAENIEGIQVYVGAFDELVNDYQLTNIFFKEHPLNSHYKGTEESREWMFDVTGYHPSFFAFYKKCLKQLKQ
jgi:deoxyribodipyrimidine photo-lyase